ncbi:glycoside hydrolase family 70 protein [Apilactobacillus kunkeei]|uniref:glycoside hydrolase family 70 protein n=1 Tax=Apilactobacillus kunkeei TaxID=148814 RepID=UPI0039E19219
MNNNNSEKKLRFKMYKSGKHWVVAGLTTAVVSVAIYSGPSIINGGVTVKADVQSTTQATTSVSDNSKDSLNSISTNNSNDDNQIATLPQDGTYSTGDNGQTWKYVEQNKNIQGLYKDSDNQLRYFNEYDGTQAKGDIVNVNNNNYYFDSGSGQGHKIDNYSGGNYVESNVNNENGWIYKATDNTEVKGIATIDGNVQYFDQSTGLQLKGGAVQVGGADYYFDPNKGNLVGKVDQVVNSNNYSDNKLLDSNKNVVKGLTVNNGTLQYYDPSTGDQVKNKQVIANGVTYYFDASGNGTYLFTNTGNSAVNDFSQRNAANSVNPSDYKNVVDGFFTADTWYRPKQIIDNGTTWRNSNSNDLRPMITAWWPNKDVQVNYLKLMQDNGLLDKSDTYTLQSDQQVLNQAAQSAQVNIEKKISQTGSTDWLNDLLFASHGNNPSFVKQQYVWNSDSESPWAGDAWLQGGYFQYSNSILTPNTNSNYRNPDNSYAFLLANDVDNSNPAVQAEGLNWAYYLTNFGTITANNPDANFDSVRLDAVDFVSNDLIERVNDYLRQKYNLTKNDINADNHISIVEAGVDAGTSVTNSDALIESPFRSLAYGLLSNSKNYSMSSLIDEAEAGKDIANHNGITDGGGIPNYSYVHAHDKGVQERVGQAIVDTTGIKDWTNFTPAQLAEGLKTFYADQRNNVKKYSDYNVPSAYALILTNNGTVPRIFYGDMYQDDGQYMQNKSYYYDDIVSLMKARKKYVAGGQSMSVDKNNFLESVRFGKGANNVNDAGNAETRNEGIGLIVGNDQNKVLNDGDTVVLHMGAAHKNQKYRALILTTNDGTQTFNSDDDAPVAETDDNGDLTFSNKDINGQANTSVRGVLNPKVAGYLAAWVPVGATENQDARTLPTSDERNDGKVLHSNDALNSNLIFEGFSNFQPTPTNKDEYANVVIAKNVQTFKDWGVTSFEMAPQYRSSQDHSFVDSTIDNGYAFSDRYDLGFGTPTKYGSDEDLRNAIKTLHANGMQVMADAVYNQLYNLPGEEVVSATRAGVTGDLTPVPFGTQLYVVNTIGGGDYQKKYGGAFLDDLKNQYPNLFKGKSYDFYYLNYADNGAGPAYLTLNHGESGDIPSDESITEWSAKYMNGTNILGRGMGYVLKDWNTGAYFKLNGYESTLPTSLTYRSGWVENPDSTWSYYSKDSITKLTGAQIVNDQRVFFDNNGIQVKGGWVENPDGTYSYYDKNSGELLVGSQLVDGRHVFFDNVGVQVKGGWVANTDGSYSYYNANDGTMLTGAQFIDGQNVYFDADGKQVKGNWVQNNDGSWSYYDANLGHLVKDAKHVDSQPSGQQANNNQSEEKSNSPLVESQNNKDSASVESQNHQNSVSVESKNENKNQSNDVRKPSEKTDTKTSNEKSKEVSKEDAAYDNAKKSLVEAKKLVDKKPNKTNINKYKKALKSYENAQKKMNKSVISSYKKAAKELNAAKKNLSKKNNKVNMKKYSIALNKYRNAKKSYVVIKKKDLDKSKSALNTAKKALAKKKTKQSQKKYNDALKKYYDAEKTYLNLTGNYTKRYYYDFDKIGKKVKVIKSTSVYNSLKPNSKKVVKKIKKGSVIKVKKLILSNKKSYFDLGYNRFVIASKSSIKKAK